MRMRGWKAIQLGPTGTRAGLAHDGRVYEVLDRPHPERGVELVPWPDPPPMGAAKLGKKRRPKT